jgi:hypothetical protein
LEKQKTYGPVDPKPNELSLANVTALLNATITAEKFLIPTVMCNSEV